MLRSSIPLRLLSVALVFATIGFASGQESSRFSSADIEFFETKVRPILNDNCLKCHGADPEDLEGGLALISRRTILEGGDSGPAVDLKQHEESLLLDVISYDGAYDLSLIHI